MLAMTGRALRIGLTGGIGSGKSAAAARFARHGVTIIDTDAIAHELTVPDGAALPALRAAFGSAVIAGDGGLDRARMRALVFADPAERVRLEAILHPMIAAEGLRRCAADTHPYVIVDVPLLTETGHWRACCDRVCVVDCPRETQIARVAERNGYLRAEIEAIVAAQASREARFAIADDIIDNSGPLDALHAQIDALHERYSALAKAAMSC
ncbi:MAG: dephospho-CoA kinase [Azoarcus sp.]|jgi:dephospho-CoA kinase|nr:dephospho-CoA kinase [Azoarcus sp.]